jgi:putative ABC transport system substrate-binding protein
MIRNTDDAGIGLRGNTMKRRAFLTAFGSAAVALPFAAGAQQAARTRRIGALMLYREDDPEGQLRARAFREGLEERGWVIGGNLQIDFHWGVGDFEWTSSAVAEMLKLAPEVLLVNGGQAVRAAQPASRTVPMVFIGAVDAVTQGWIQSLARPGGNMTGFVVLPPSLGAKWLELLKEVAPQVNRVAVLINTENSSSMVLARSAAAAAEKLAVEAIAVHGRTAAEIEAAMEMLASTPKSGLIVPPDPVVTAHRKLIVGLAARYRLPAVYGVRGFAADGGLISYGASIPALFRQAAGYVDQILRGEKAADLPVQRPTTFELVINLRAAKDFGIALNPQLLALANELIE